MNRIHEYRLNMLYNRLVELKVPPFEVKRAKGSIKIIYNNKLYTVKLILENNCLYWHVKPYKHSYFMVKCKNDPDFNMLLDVLSADSSIK